MPDTPTIALSTPAGPVPIPQIGFGVWQVPEDEVASAVASALQAGYRHVDTAAAYRNEVGVGRALAESNVPRDDNGREATLAAFDDSVANLGVDVLDLYLIHWPAPAQDRYVETWRTLLELRDAGRVRAVGVCNFGIDHLQRLADETGELPPINQIELHPYFQQRELVAFHRQHRIVTQAWSPLASGKRVLDDPVLAGIAQRHRATPAQVVISWHLA